MADPRAFISFDADNNSTEKILFAGQTYLSTIPFAIQDWSSKEPLPQAEWEALIKSKIAKTHMLIVLCGNSMSTATGVVKEINMANSQNVPIFGVYVDGAGANSVLPTGLPRSRVIDWNWTKIGNAITQVMKEGKNKLP